MIGYTNSRAFVHARPALLSAREDLSHPTAFRLPQDGRPQLGAGDPPASDICFLSDTRQPHRSPGHPTFDRSVFKDPTPRPCSLPSNRMIGYTNNRALVHARARFSVGSRGPFINSPLFHFHWMGGHSLARVSRRLQWSCAVPFAVHTSDEFTFLASVRVTHRDQQADFAFCLPVSSRHWM